MKWSRMNILAKSMGEGLFSLLKSHHNGEKFFDLQLSLALSAIPS